MKNFEIWHVLSLPYKVIIYGKFQKVPLSSLRMAASVGKNDYPVAQPLVCFWFVFTTGGVW
jgi:hypothetical protein